MYKLLVTDFDNTLLDSDEAIPISTMLEIDRIRKNGILFAVATSRVMTSVMDYNRDFPFLDYIMACNGAYVYDTKKSKVIFKKNIMASVVKKIKKLYSDYDIYFCTDKYWYLLKGNNSNNRKLEDREILITDFDSFYEENKSSIYKIEIIFDDKKIREKIYSSIKKLEFKIQINKFSYNKTMFGIEITMDGVDKLFGIKKICSKNKIDMEEVIAIGDDENDISMVKNVGMGIAVSNASSKLKKVAKMKTSSNDTKGVEKVIKKLL